MSPSLQTLIVGGIQVPLDTLEGDVCFMAQKQLKRVGIFPKNGAYSIYRRSVDARKRDQVRFVYSVAVTASFGKGELEKVKTGSLKGISLLKTQMPQTQFGSQVLEQRPVVVGSGPAGLFCAYELASNGYRPILIERGGNVEERKAAILRFSSKRLLDTETNVQFGAGGAGTFSDGKLMSRVNDPMTGYVLDTFCSLGAPQSIRTEAKPHIGTDILANVVDAMIEKIKSLGGEVHFHTRLDGFLWRGERICGVKTNKGEIPCGLVVLAIGHSARDTYEMLLKAPLAIEAKPFSVGVRVEHLQSDIDTALYGKFAGHPKLGHAEYHLSHDTHGRGVYSFCMCPGGTVMAAASEEGGVVVNGMSYHARDGKNANSAIVASVFREDYGGTPQGAISYQRKIERDAFLAGGSDYSTPLTTMGDFLEDRSGTAPTRIQPTYMEGNGYRLAKPDVYLPPYIVTALRGGMAQFEKNISGFTAKDALLSGAETRTSSPVRILREPETRKAIGAPNLYPCGEGAGYAGGITSAALDGIHTALAIMRTYCP